MNQTPEHSSGFTLIELSIVLVIIGLIVGGVLVGQDLIRAAYIRATITQVEQFNTGVNTFYGKYGALPGDMNYTTAKTFQFATVDNSSVTRGSGGPGSGNGDGLIESNFNGDDIQPDNWYQGAGETGFFWSDLTYANGMNISLIPGSFNGSCLSFNNDFNAFSCMQNVPGYQKYALPTARLGNGNYFYVYQLGGYNYYGLSVPTTLQALMPSNPGLTMMQAYTIDTKIDDGRPTSGNVVAYYMSTSGGVPAYTSSPNAAVYTNTTCYNSTTKAYATDSKLGGMCGLSFKFQ